MSGSTADAGADAQTVWSQMPDMPDINWAWAVAMIRDLLLQGQTHLLAPFLQPTYAYSTQAVLPSIFLKVCTEYVWLSSIRNGTDFRSKSITDRYFELKRDWKLSNVFKTPLQTFYQSPWLVCNVNPDAVNTVPDNVNDNELKEIDLCIVTNQTQKRFQEQLRKGPDELQAMFKDSLRAFKTFYHTKVVKLPRKTFSSFESNPICLFLLPNAFGLSETDWRAKLRVIQKFVSSNPETDERLKTQIMTLYNQMRQRFKDLMKAVKDVNAPLNIDTINREIKPRLNAILTAADTNCEAVKNLLGAEYWFVVEIHFKVVSLHLIRFLLTLARGYLGLQIDHFNRLGRRSDGKWHRGARRLVDTRYAVAAVVSGALMHLPQVTGSIDDEQTKWVVTAVGGIVHFIACGYAANHINPSRPDVPLANFLGVAKPEKSLFNDVTVKLEPERLIALAQRVHTPAKQTTLSKLRTWIPRLAHVAMAGFTAYSLYRRLQSLDSPVNEPDYTVLETLENPDAVSNTHIVRLGFKKVLLETKYTADGKSYLRRWQFPVFEEEFESKTLKDAYVEASVRRLDDSPESEWEAVRDQTISIGAWMKKHFIHPGLETKTIAEIKKDVYQNCLRGTETTMSGSTLIYNAATFPGFTDLDTEIKQKGLAALKGDNWIREVTPEASTQAQQFDVASVLFGNHQLAAIEELARTHGNTLYSLAENAFNEWAEGTHSGLGGLYLTETAQQEPESSDMYNYIVGALMLGAGIYKNYNPRETVYEEYDLV